MPIKFRRDALLEMGRQVESLRFPSIASLYGVHNTPTPRAELLGSGTYVRHRDDVFVLTAMHVVRNSAKYSYVFHDAGGDGDNMVPCKLGWTGWEEPFGDLALWGCFAEAFAASDRIPLPLVEPFDSNNIAPNSLLLASGWPQDQSFSLPFAQEYRSTLHSIMGPPILNIDIPDHCFAFKCANDRRYFGMSGSSVWNLNLNRCKVPEEWTPKMSTFAGVVTRWDPHSGVIVATKSEVVKQFLSGAIKRLRTQWGQGVASATQNGANPGLQKDAPQVPRH